MIHIDLSPEVEKQLLSISVARGLDPTVYVHQVIERAVITDARPNLRTPTLEEFRAALDRMAEIGKHAQPLSEYALTRESFYEDHD